MSTHLYLSMIPESLVASMLPPVEFGRYLATGTVKRPHGQAMFFRLKQGFDSGHFDLSELDRRCVAHPDGTPKHSVYLAIYRVLEHVPLDALEGLYLVTAHGRVLELVQGSSPPRTDAKYHLYQELCPVHPLIASSLEPEDFCRFVTDRSRAISVPRICFVDLSLGGMAEDPWRGRAADLPYHDVSHLGDCLMQIARRGGKQTKTVDRVSQQAILYRCVQRGFFVGDQQRVVHYPYPTPDELEGRHYEWWRCANDGEVERFGGSA